MKKYFLKGLEIIKENRRAYIIINIVYYGLVAVGMVYVAFHPAVQQTLLQTTGQALLEGPLKSVSSAYMGAKVLPAIALTFLINLVMGSMLSITLPSLVIPFSGLLMGVYRALLWGLILSPANPGLRLLMIPHTITLILEGQAYILALLAAFVQGKCFVMPKGVGAASAWQGYKEGLKRTGWMYVLIIAVLLIAAIYEALEVILMAKLLVP